MNNVFSMQWEGMLDSILLIFFNVDANIRNLVRIGKLSYTH